MSKVRINDLARELEVKSKAILDALPIVGVTEKKTHSSSLEEHEAEKVRAHIRGSSEGAVVVCPFCAPAAWRRRNQDQDRFVAYLPAGRCAQSHHPKEGSDSGSGPAHRAACSRQASGCASASGGETNAACRRAANSRGDRCAPTARCTTGSGRADGGEAGCQRARKCRFGCSDYSCASTIGNSSGSACHQVSSIGCAVCDRICRASGSSCRTSACANGGYGSASSAAHDRSADWAASGVQSSAAASDCAGCTDQALRAGTMRPAPGRPVPGQPIFQRPRPQVPGGGPPRPLRPGRTPSHASHAPGASGCASSWCRSGASASGTSSSGQPSRCSGAPARPALCSAWRKRRPHEGLHAAAAHGGVE